MVVAHVTHRGPYQRCFILRSLVLGLLPIVLGGCAAIMMSPTTRLAESLSSSILNQDDPQTVKDGAPAYLLLIDGLIQDDRDNIRLLMTGAKLYGAYGGMFVEDMARSKPLTTRAREYGSRALCEQRPAVCPTLSRPYNEFVRAIATLTANDVPALYTWAVVSAGWIQAHSDDWNAVAELPKVEAAIQRVVALDEGYEDGSAHLYLAVLLTLRPPALGGKPEKGRQHFERAIEISRGRNLMAKVLFAKHYARLIFDRPLHDRLLQEVMAANAIDPGYTLSNTIAKQEAGRLLATADDYF